MTRLSVLLVSLAGLAACGGESRPPEVLTPEELANLQRMERLQVVDWETGRPSVAALLEGEDLSTLDPATETKLWKVSGGQAFADGRGRLAVRAAEGQPGVALTRSRLTLDTREVDLLRFELELVDAATVGVILTVGGPGEGEPTKEQPHRIQVPAGGLHELRVPVTGTGILSKLRLELPPGATLGPITAQRRSFELAVSPRVGPDGPVDVGLGQLERRSEDRMQVRSESRRSLPTIDGRSQLAPYEGGGSPRLYLAAALPDDYQRLKGPVTFEVLVRESIDAPPTEGAERIHRLVLDPRRDAEVWHPFWVDLPGRLGESWEVLLRAEGGAPGGVNGLFATPVLVRRDAPRGADLVLVTTDTLRADHVGANREALGLGGLPGLETEFMDALAARGTNWVDVLSTSNATSPAHATIHTGLFPRDHRVRDNQRKLAEEAETLAELIHDQYFCVASVTTRHLNSLHSGLGQGFDLVFEVPMPLDESWPQRPNGIEDLPPVHMENYLHRNAAFANPRLEQFLAESGELPLFLWLHYFDPHTPYVVRDEIAAELLAPETPEAPPVLEQLALARAEFRGQDLPRETAILSFLVDVPHLAFMAPYRSIERVKSLYAAGVTQFDRDIAEIFATLESQGRDPLVVFTADHGEALGERNIWFDHAGAYDNTLRVPLILAGPGVPAGEVVRAPVSTIDILPTVLGLVGAEGPDYLPGIDLLAAAPPADRRRWFQHSGDLSVGFREGDQHLFYAARDHELGAFRLPYAKGQVTLEVDGTPVEPTEEQTADVAKQIRDWMFAPIVNLDELQADLSDADRAELRALGYTDD